MIRHKNLEDKLYIFLKKHGAYIEKDVFSYGFITFLNYFAYFIIIFPLSLWFHLVDKIIIFLLFFIPLRRYIGGYHFNSKILCLLFSIILSILISEIATSVGFIDIKIRVLTLFIGIIATYWIKAIDHPNKRISKQETIFYTRKAIYTELFYGAIIIFLYDSPFYVHLNIAFLSLIFCILSLALARIKEFLYTYKEGIDVV